MEPYSNLFSKYDPILQFNRYLNRNNVIIPSYFYKGIRKAQVLHTRLRTNCSALNHHLFSKNIVDTSLRSCGSIENNFHFLFNCPKYTEIRVELIQTLSPICTLSLKTLLFGDENLSNETNTVIFETVQKYILASKRF